jgi:hypothetical protein
LANIIRKAKNKENPYAQIDKAMLNNSDISLKAKGLLSILLSKPDDWETIIENLVNTSLDGWDSVKSGLRELENYGYIIRRRIRDEKGVITGSETLVYDEPQHPPKKPVEKKRYKTKPQEDNPSEVDLQEVELKEDNPPEGNPPEGNRTLLKQSITKTEDTKILSDLIEFETIGDLQDHYVQLFNLPWENVLAVYDRVADQYKAGNIDKSFKLYFEAALKKEKEDYERNKFINGGYSNEF